MNLVLPFLWKEWRAQRSTLISYTLLIFTCLCLGLSLAPTHSWFEEGFGAHALSWFVLAGIFGVVAFVAPALVRAEFGAKDDQFVRRLPGVLWPAFGGKLLFLVLATITLPLLGLLVGELFVTARGQNWDGLVGWEWDGSTQVRWPAEVVFAGAALLLVPWIWALGTWLPGGRMAVGATALFVLLVGVCVTAVVRQSPKIENGIDWHVWLWAVAPLGLVTAGVSWGLGRRGGGPLRSARFGLCAAAVGLLPPSLWFADRAWDYHHPDPQQLAKLDVRGLSCDGRYVLAGGAAHEDFCLAWFRIDLQNGHVEQIAGIARGFGTELVRPYVWSMSMRGSYWRTYGEWGVDQNVLDLGTGTWTPIAYDRTKHVPVLPAELRERVLAERRERTLLRGPDGLRVWCEGTTMSFEEADGSVTRQEVPELKDASLWPAGHGVLGLGGKKRLFDFSQRQLRKEPVSLSSTFLVRGTLLWNADTKHWRKWTQCDPGAEPQPCDALDQCRVFGLFDDDHLLVGTWPNKWGIGGKLFLYRPADRSMTILPLPACVPGFSGLEEASPLFQRGSLLARDPTGGVWLTASNATRREFLRIDSATRSIEHRFGSGNDEHDAYQLLAFPDAHSVLVRQGARILRLDATRGTPTVLFPR
ncbi:MAG: hypothetical protein IT456_23045 [Planctomycetes bacterium]|jgi:hypothetical protein|nr:hypothetical protein [Planctomycetota bacterium]